MSWKTWLNWSGFGLSSTWALISHRESGGKRRTYDQKPRHVHDDARDRRRGRLGVEGEDLVLDLLERQALSITRLAADRTHIAGMGTHDKLLGDVCAALCRLAFPREHRLGPLQTPPSALSLHRQRAAQAHVEAGEARAVGVESGVVKVGELLRDRVDVRHVDEREGGGGGEMR
jgi:hypothetical protein